MKNTIKLFSTAERLTLNALDQLQKQNINTKLDPHTFKLINRIVWNVCKQLENAPEIKKHAININD